MVGFLLGVLLVVQPPDSVENNIPVLYDSLKNENSGAIVLTEINGWKYHPGDDLGWSNSEYNDSAWYKLKSVNDVPDSLWNGMGWWRLTFRVDSALAKEAFGIKLDSYGATEVYLNGKLVSSRGQPALNPEQQNIAAPLTKVAHLASLTPGELHTIAVRYSFHHHDWYYKVSGASFYLSDKINFSIRLLDTNTLNNHTFLNKLNVAALSLASIILMIVMMLHLSMYYRFRKNEANLWIFLITFFLWLYTAGALFTIYFGVFSGSAFVYIISIVNLAISFAICLVPYVLGKVYKITIHPFWGYYIWFAVVFMVLRSIFSDYLLVESIHGLSLFLILCIPFIAGLAITYRAYKKEVKNIWLIAGALLGFPILAMLSIAQSFLADQYYVTEIVIYFLYLTILPVGFSIYQIKNFFALHENLEQRVKERTAELEEAYSDLQQSLKDLKSTQDQLVQQEKLASLGQLTAGIAHEIKNPLNFVNNFSDLSVELVEEAREELQSETADGKRETTDEALDILDDVEANLKKINEHGSRADGIVKSMLQHSRGGDGEMEPTDLNGLIEEYVNLSFHGMRASENPINVDIEMDLDEKVGKIPLIAEDFSRVIINLCNNAFDAMRKKQEAVGSRREAGEDYEPKLTVRTVKDNEQVKIEIEDNGPGIPEDVRDKILQPFFTTKKGTEGTGLGLSITNDIVKAHGGEIQITSQKNKYTCFRISLNTNNN